MQNWKKVKHIFTAGFKNKKSKLAYIALLYAIGRRQHKNMHPSVSYATLKVCWWISWKKKYLVPHKLASLKFLQILFRGETIRVHHDMIRIMIQRSQYDTYRDMLYTGTCTAEKWKNILIFGSQILQLEINLWIITVILMELLTMNFITGNIVNNQKF